MKKIILTVIATSLVTSGIVYCWDQIVVGQFGYYNYPDWIAYGIISVCAILGGRIGAELNKVIKVHFRKKKTYFVKEL